MREETRRDEAHYVDSIPPSQGYDLMKHCILQLQTTAKKWDLDVLDSLRDGGSTFVNLSPVTWMAVWQAAVNGSR